MGDVFEVQVILDSRRTKGGEFEYKIRWKGYGPSEDTWEPEENLIHCEELLRDYKNKMAAEQRNRTQLEARDRDLTPNLPKRRLRQRNTPKVQRVLGVKQMPPPHVNYSEVPPRHETSNKIKCETTGKCNKWAMFGGLVCFMIGAILLYLSVD
ncbi:chromodomain Y-like protein 2 [Lytechinus variegatus]|uniref:chromodomain Y-like protein 2 n=1 Tax=Lytechinus variegatus TaxID=7654 RepID=UPI001BB16C42|nr:chromodomain Y-like protein 2 [Lytechinus variegatus]XP_041454132.1 chromodomain Y-like protein 2 [Lytechinus variegatus]